MSESPPEKLSSSAATTTAQITTPPPAIVALNSALHATLQLTNSNYASWKLQITSLLRGYNLLGFIDGTQSEPSKVVTINGSSSPNPDHDSWMRQDSLVLNALLGSISPDLLPIIAHTTTAREAWVALADSFGNPSRGQIKQVKQHLRSITKGNSSVSTYLKSIKAKADELASLGAPVDPEDLIDLILNNLGPEYIDLSRAIQARDSLISFAVRN